MAAEGLRFTDFYSTSAACVPSHVGMLTGRHPGHASIRDNFPPHVDLARENGGEFMEDYPEGAWPPKQPTLGRVIKDAGYRTVQFGKLEAGIPMAAGESRNLTDAHPEIVENMRRIMEEARQGSEFTKYWKFPERRPQVGPDHL